MAEMGQRMLRGERMMAQSCEYCPVPLMQSDRGCVCCQCHRVYQLDEYGDLREKETKAVTSSSNSVAQKETSKNMESSERPPTATPSGPLAAASGARVKREGGVGHVGEHLLKGWTMLADSCPLCLSPIMRNPADASMWCVECNVQAVTEKEFDASKQKRIQSPRELVQENLLQQQQQKVQHVPPRVPQPSSSSLNQAAASLRITLAARLQAANAALAAIPIENTAAASVLLKHICDIAAAIQAIDLF